MSYLSEVKSGKLTPAQGLKKSVAWLFGLAKVKDSDVDKVVTDGQHIIDATQDEAAALFATMITKAFPAVPAGLRDVLAAKAVHAGYTLIDAGLSGLGDQIKKLTPDD